MIVRSLDDDHDWNFGKGRQDYLGGVEAIMQMIETRLYEFLGDAFFAMQEGIDWFNLLSGNTKLELDLVISARILNTAGVTGIQQLSSDLNRTTRSLTVSYQVQTIYSTAYGLFEFDTTSSFL